MEKVATFFTIYWCIYFPTCIAYNDVMPIFSYIDEAMTGVIIVYTIMMRKKWYVNHGPLQETWQCILVFAFFTIYGLLFSRNVAGGVWLDFIQEMRPYSVVYCTWILNPQFTEKQKKWMLRVMVITLISWIILHPTSELERIGIKAEFPVLGQLAICTGMTWYLLTKPTKKNSYIALALACSGMIAPKFKYMGEVACFIAAVFFLKEHLSFKKAKTVLVAVGLVVVVLFVTWERVDAYYVTGMSNENLARPMTYKTALQILYDYFPFGSGMGSFACNGAWKFYSPIYPEYHLDHIWGLDAGGGFICDAYYPTLAQYGVVGIFFFIVFWERKVRLVNSIKDMRYYRVAWITFFCLAIEQTADSSWLSGKGMGYCMLLGLCFNADLNNKIEEEDEEDDNEEEDEENEFEDDREDELTAPARSGLITLGHKFKIRSWREDRE